MRQFRTYQFFILLFLCVGLASLYGQDSGEVQDYNEDEWIEARGDIDYSDDIVKDRKRKERDDQVSQSSDMNFPDIAGVLLIILLVVLVLFILYFMLGKENVFRPKSKKIKTLNLESIEQIEENLVEHDVANYLEQAINNKQYRIAIRLHYLLIIKELSTKKFIKWKREKTNRNYLYETEQYSFSNNFKKSTSIFEKVWYGEREVLEQDFSVIHSQFNELNKEINILSL